MTETRTRKELVAAYEISSSTFYRWTKVLKLRYARVYTPKQLQSIYQLLGNPYE